MSGMAPEKYEQFYTAFGPYFQSRYLRGLRQQGQNRRPAPLPDHPASEGKLISLADYVSRMKEDQKEIYYITGESLALLQNSPHLERLKERDVEVLLMTDPIDEWVVRDLRDYEKKTFKSAETGDLDLNVDDKMKEAYSALFDTVKSNLEEKVKEVKPSTHLKESAACLSGDEYGMSAYMEKILKAAGARNTGDQARPGNQYGPPPRRQDQEAVRSG